MFEYQDRCTGTSQFKRKAVTFRKSVFTR